MTGSIVVSGSSTVEPITSLVAEDFAANNPDFDYEVDGPGTGDGFALFCNGETDISDASRPISEEETALCEEAGIPWVELKVGIDGISVLTSPSNDAVTCLSFGDLYSLLGPESQGFDNWSDADDLAAELDGGDFGTLQLAVPGCAARHDRPRRGVRHIRQLPRDRLRRHRRGPRDRGGRPTRLHRLGR